MRKATRWEWRERPGRFLSPSQNSWKGENFSQSFKSCNVCFLTQQSQQFQIPREFTQEEKSQKREFNDGCLWQTFLYKNMQCLLNSNSKHPNIRFQNTNEQSMMITDPWPEKEAINNQPTLPPWPVQVLISNHESLKCNRLSHGQPICFVWGCFLLIDSKISLGDISSVWHIYTSFTWRWFESLVSGHIHFLSFTCDCTSSTWLTWDCTSSTLLTCDCTSWGRCPARCGSPPPGGLGWSNFQAAILFLEILNFDFVVIFFLNFDLKIKLGWSNFQAEIFVSWKFYLNFYLKLKLFFSPHPSYE